MVPLSRIRASRTCKLSPARHAAKPPVHFYFKVKMMHSFPRGSLFVRATDWRDAGRWLDRMFKIRRIRAVKYTAKHRI